jgi:hypothetical protein
MKKEKIDQSGEGDEEAPLVDLITFMQASPLAKAIAEDGIDFDIERQIDFERDIDFGDPS